MTYSAPLAIEFQSVSIRRGTRVILHDIDLSVARGTTTAVLGANGSGKSTLLRIVAGYWYPTAGRVSVLGERFGKTNLPELRRRIRLVGPPGPYEHPSKMSVSEIVASGVTGSLVAQLDPDSLRDRIADLLCDVGLQGRHASAYGTLSTGERLRVGMARARIGDAELLLLDEPTGGLDLPMREAVLQLIDRWHGKVTMLLVTHHTEELPVQTDQIVVLKEGAVFANGVADDVLTSDTLSRAYAVPVKVDKQNGRYWTRLAASPGAANAGDG